MQRNIKFMPPRAAGQYDADAVSDETGLFCPEPTLAQQHQAEEADINTIVKRFGVTGQLPVVPMPPLSADFDDVFDFHAAQNLIAQANQSFMALPAEARARFGNDPGRFVAYVDDALESGNLEELRKMGLAVPKESRDGGADGKAGGNAQAASGSAAGSAGSDVGGPGGGS